jgi:hypothetical protein
MIQSELQISALITKVRMAMEAGQKVAVLGLKPKESDDVLRRLEKEKRVILLRYLPHTGLGTSVGYAIHTHRIGHSIVDAVKKSRIPVWPVSLETNQLHEVFRACSDLLRPTQRA